MTAQRQADPCGDRRWACLDWEGLAEDLNRDGAAVTPPLLTAEDCRAVSSLFDQDAIFRSTVVMARHSFGQGVYKYFADPLPGIVAELRQTLYPPLARIANDWAERLGETPSWPATLEGLKALCQEAGQTRPTPLLLRYGPGDYNCLHQDLYGAVHFPVQAAILLDRPGVDFEGGELTLVENRPRRQARCFVAPQAQGCAVLFPVRERPVQGSRGAYRASMRHGVSVVRSGRRHTLGVIFHDAQ